MEAAGSGAVCAFEFDAFIANNKSSESSVGLLAGWPVDWLPSNALKSAKSQFLDAPAPSSVNGADAGAAAAGAGATGALAGPPNALAKSPKSFGSSARGLKKSSSAATAADGSATAPAPAPPLLHVWKMSSSKSALLAALAAAPPNRSSSACVCRCVGELMPNSSRPKFEAAPMSIFLLVVFMADLADAVWPPDSDFGLTVTLIAGLRSDGVVARGVVVADDDDAAGSVRSLSR